MQLPNHIGIIPDGNRRWAKKKGLAPHIGHWYGAKKLEEVLKYLYKLGIKKVSIYALSTENIKNRSKKEIKELFKIFKHYFVRWNNGKFKEIDEYRVKVNFFGNFVILPKSLVRLMRKISERTKKYRDRVLNVLIAYGGTYEIISAIKKLMSKNIKIERIDENVLKKYLFVKDDVDLIIRTGGYSRLSNFLPLQSAYAEIYVTKKLWPEITKRDILNAIKWYNKIQRNFGR
ncbi:MAG: polyprenyl diphosphate synthase [Candidatus Aenigmatarchaeota archaeon]